MTSWLGLPIAASAHAAEIDRVLLLVHGLMLVLFVGWGVYFAWVLVRFRRGRHPVAVRTGIRGRWSTAIEFAVLTAEVTLLAFFSIPAWSARVDRFPAESGSTLVRVVAEQFAWNVHYPGADGRFGRSERQLVTRDNPLGLDRLDPAGRDDVTTVNELHLPVGRPVIVQLSSKDVVHSFTLNEMRVKQDAVPGVEQPVWFIPTITGSWEIACSQLCGLAHYRMRGSYTVESAREFEEWLAEAALP